MPQSMQRVRRRTSMEQRQQQARAQLEQVAIAGSVGCFVQPACSAWWWRRALDRSIVVLSQQSGRAGCALPSQLASDSNPTLPQQIRRGFAPCCTRHQAREEGRAWLLLSCGGCGGWTSWPRCTRPGSPDPPTGTVGAVPASSSGLRVAVTGPTGTFGFGLLPLLEADTRVASVVGVARRPFDPSEHGWSKMVYRQGDVREPATLEAAFDGADVVVHLAFIVNGTAADPDTVRAINVDGTLNAFRAASAAGAKRFVYASSVAAYGFHADNPTGITEDWATRPAAHLAYAQEKAELEAVLARESVAHPELDLYVLRPPVVLGPHAVGGKSALADRLLPIGRRAAALGRRLPVHVPVVIPDLPLQLIHEDDVGSAFVQCIVGAGPPGAYNVAADGTVTGADVARELGLLPLAVSPRPFQRLARLAAAVPVPRGAPPVAAWAESISNPPIVDTTKAKKELGWMPRHSAIEALRATI
jgi:nucleoside-diphosphate-sugar epimerase